MFESNSSVYFVLAGQRVLGGSAPVNIPGSLARSSSFNSLSSLSTSPLSSLSQSLSQSLLSGAVSQQNPSSAMLAKQEHGLLGTPTSSSQNSLGKMMGVKRLAASEPGSMRSRFEFIVYSLGLSWSMRRLFLTESTANLFNDASWSIEHIILLFKGFDLCFTCIRNVVRLLWFDIWKRFWV